MIKSTGRSAEIGYRGGSSLLTSNVKSPVLLRDSYEHLKLEEKEKKKRVLDTSTVAKSCSKLQLLS